MDSQPPTGPPPAALPPPLPPPLPPRRPRSSVWQVVGITIAVVVGVMGLVAMAGVILLMVAINSLGDNK